MERQTVTNKSIWFPAVLLIIITTICYSNTLQSSWQLDDKPAIVDNNRLHPNSLSWPDVKATFFSNTSTTQSGSSLYRPIPCFTLAINWLIGEDKVIGYHIFNLTIHVINAVLLFYLLLELFNTPVLQNRYSSADILFIALLSTTLWAINPVQTQAVTYIVQRMASLATLFVLLSIKSYLSARNKNTTIKPKALILPILFYLGALLCKENTIVLPLLITIIEITFFRIHLHLVKMQRIFVLFLILVVIFIIAAAPFILKENIVELIENLYINRQFTPLERLLTESRILVFYLSLLFYPLPQRLSIAHEIPLSTTFLTPITTLFSVIFILSLCGFALLYKRRYPLLSLSILFYFCGHLVESTILPLELVFEHRNYLPSLFVFTPFSICILAALKKLKNKVSLQSVTKIAVILLLISLGISTHTRNKVWKTQETLWVDAADKYPGNSRVLNQLSIIIAWNDEIERRNPDLAIFST